jgi:ATP-dependent DNA ligase
MARRAAFNHPAWLFEPKYDGFRDMAYLTRKGCTIYSKRGNAFARFPELVERICAELPRREVILDGEVVAIDEEGRVSFWDLMRGRGYLAYVRRRGVVAEWLNAAVLKATRTFPTQSR